MSRTTSRRTFNELSADEQEAFMDDTERILDELDPAVIADADRMEDLQAISDLVERIAEADEELTAAIALSRRLGRSWGDIARVLGVTRQSAHAKYAELVEG